MTFDLRADQMGAVSNAGQSFNKSDVRAKQIFYRRKVLIVRTRLLRARTISARIVL